MKTIIISIGNELTSGHIVNTNASWMARKLEPFGITPDKVIAIRDEYKTLVSEIRSATKKYELVLITGGLGPTPDDITKPALLKVFNTKLIRHKKTLATVKRMFKTYSANPMPLVNLGQADIPEGCEPLPNRWGTAPGLCFTTEKGLLFALPGVPYEMKMLMTHEALPRIGKRFRSNKAIARIVLRTVGIGESALYTMMEKMKVVDDDIELAFLPHMGQVDLRITATASSKLKARQRLTRARKKIMKVVKPYYFGKEGEALEAAIQKLMIKKKLSLASAESCTGGLFASKITSVSGSSKYFIEGVVTYSDEAKRKRLKVKQKTLDTHGAVSPQVAMEMAKGACKTSGADVGISVTGIAGPTGGTKEKPVGLVYFGLSINGKTKTKEKKLREPRTRNQERAVQVMLTWLFKELSLL